MTISSSYDRARLQRSRALLDPYLEKPGERPNAEPARRSRRKSPGTPLVMVLVGALGLGAGLSISSLLGDRDPSDAAGSVTSLAAPNAARAQENDRAGGAAASVEDDSETRETATASQAPDAAGKQKAVAQSAAGTDRPDTAAIVTGATVRAPLEIRPEQQPSLQSATAGANDEAVPDAADARWAKDVVARPARSLDELADMAAGDEEDVVLALGQQQGSARSVVFPPADARAIEPPDSERTSAIPPEASQPAEAVSSGRPVVRNVKVNDHVNMRTRAQSGSRVIRVVPKGATVGLVGCDVWCEIVVGGTRGYVFRSFVEGQGGDQRRANAVPAQPEPAQAEEPRQAAQTQRRSPTSINTPVFDQGNSHLP